MDLDGDTGLEDDNDNKNSQGKILKTTINEKFTLTFILIAKITANTSETNSLSYIHLCTYFRMTCLNLALFSRCDG